METRPTGYGRMRVVGRLSGERSSHIADKLARNKIGCEHLERLQQGKMPNFRRYYVPNSLVFITVVTHKRVPYLKTSKNVDLLFDTLRCVQQIHPFHLLAYVILPNHFHWLMSVENDVGNFSTVLHSAKRNYSLNYKKIHSIDKPAHIWQERFWDHVIRDEEDLSKHFDYIHFNPVKHGYVKKPEDWPYSTYMFWYERKYYPDGWGYEIEPENIVGLNFE